MRNECSSKREGKEEEGEEEKVNLRIRIDFSSPEDCFSAGGSVFGDSKLREGDKRSRATQRKGSSVASKKVYAAIRNAVLGRNKQNRTPSQQESVASHLFTILITISLLVVYGRWEGRG